MTMTADPDTTHGLLADDTEDDDAPAGPSALSAAEDAALLPYRGSILTIRPDQVGFSGEQRAALTTIGVPLDAPAAYVAAFFHLCAASQLDPFLGHATLMRTDRGWVPFIKFVGLKYLAERTGEFWGFEPNEYLTSAGDWVRGPWSAKVYGGFPMAVRSGVRRGTGPDRFVVTQDGVAWDEIAPTRSYLVKVTSGGKEIIHLPEGEEVLDPYWAKNPGSQLGKCGQARCVRSAWGIGWYVEEEMGRARVEGERAQLDEELAGNSQDRRAAYAASRTGVVTPTGMQRARDLMNGVLARASAERPDGALDSAYAAAHRAEPPAGPAPGEATRSGQVAEQPGRLAEADYQRLALAELRWQAEQLDRPVELLTAGMALAHPEPLEEWPSEVMLTLVAELRPAVARRLEAAGRVHEAARYRLAARDDIATVDELLGKAAA